jgi:S1-C subfamily serine protease
MSTEQNQSGQPEPSQASMSILPPPPPWIPGEAAQGGHGGYGGQGGYGGYGGQGGYSGYSGQGGQGGGGEQPPGHGKRRRRLAMTASVAAVGLAVGAGAVYAMGGTSTAAMTTASTALSTAQIASRVSPGLVDVVSTLGYQNAEAAGTGMVVTSSGEVLTNNHVIDGATSIKATDVGNGRTYTATVVGYDKTDDVAVLQLQGASGLSTVSFGNSSGVTTGETVVALGNAGGKGGTPSVATGKVTALNQAITASDDSSGTSESLTGMIQTNADIQAGDSGGSLVNAEGQVIGMDTAASSSSEMSSPYGQSPYGQSPSSQSQTEGFAIPINKALSIASEIEAGDASSTVHIGATGFLGVEVGSSGSSFMPGGEQDSTGVAVEGTLSGSPAAGAGLSAGDVIDSVNGHAVSSSSDVQSVIGQDHPGDKVSVVWTDQYGQTHTSTVTLANGPAD